MNESLIAFRREVLKRSVADLCRRSGWEGVTTRVMEVLVDLMEKYIMKLSTTAKAYSELYNRHTPNLTDMWLSYKQNGVDLSELNEYLENVEDPSPTYQVPLFPAPRNCLHNEEKSINKKDKHNKHKNDLPNSNITNSPSLTLERKSSGTNVQQVNKEKPLKAKSSSYQMKSILSLDSRVVDAGLPSINPSASRRVLLRPQQSIKDYSYNQHYPNHHNVYHDNQYNKYTKQYSDEEDFIQILSAELPKRHDEWEDDQSIEGQRHRKMENRYRKGTKKKHLLPDNHSLSLNKNTNFYPNKSKKIGWPSSTASQSTPTATLIASLKKTRKATIKEAFMSKKKLHINPHPLDSEALHHNKAVVRPTVMSNNNSSNDKYNASAFNFGEERVKKKPGRKPKKKFGKVPKNSSFDNAYNNYNTNANLMDNVNNLHNKTLPSESLQDRTFNIVVTEEKEDGWCVKNSSKYKNPSGTNYHNSNINNIGGVDDKNGYGNTKTIGGKDEVKEEVVSCNDVSEEILPWTDAENSPDKKNNDDNILDNKHTDINHSFNNNSFFNKTSFNNSSDNSFINVCDRSNSNINELNNDNQELDNYNDSAPSKAWRQTCGGKDNAPDVSKVTGLELILGSKQPNVQDSVNNSDPLNFDPNNVLGERISKKKGKKSKKQKKEARDARRLNNNLNNKLNNSNINNHTNPKDSNTDNYNTTSLINNNDTNNSRQQEINLNENKHNDLSHYRDNISYGDKVVGKGNGKEEFLEDNLSTLVSVAVDQRDKLHEVAPSNYNKNTLPSHPTFLQPSLSNTPLNNTYNTSENTYHNLNTQRLLSAANISLDACAEKKKKKKKSKKRKYDNELTPDETTKKPKMDEKLSVPKLTFKFLGNTVCGVKPSVKPLVKPLVKPKQPVHPAPPPPNRPIVPIKLVIKPFLGKRQQHSPSHHSNSSSRSQSPDDLARLAVGQRKADIYDSDHSIRRRSPIYSDSSSPQHTPLNALRNSTISSTPVLPSSRKSRGQKNSIITSTPISLSSRSLKPSKSAVGKTKRSVKAGKITKPNGEVIWICPTCGFPDNGSPMIGCDKCDDWYHWVCVNITEEPPEEVSWFCTFCISQASNNKNNNNNNKRGRPSYKKK